MRFVNRTARSKGLAKVVCLVVVVAIAAVFIYRQNTAHGGKWTYVGEPSVAETSQTTRWSVTGGDDGGARYSPLADINVENVKRLKVAWTYRHGDYKSASGPDRVHRSTSFEATPLLVEGRLIFTTPFNRVIALDPETGAELWKFDPGIDRGRRFANMLINRGVAYWRGPNGSGRVYLGTLDARLIALEAATGKPCADFGVAGTVNLLESVEHVTDPWEYNLTSPPTVVGDNVIVGSSIADVTRRIQPSGLVRAYDARTGAFVWRFNTIPKAGEAGNETWENESWKQTGGANVWSTMTADIERGLVFLPVSAAGPDFFGGDRPGANLFSDSVVALEAMTGKYRWHFQTVHHDLWDYDLAPPPNLARVKHNGREIDAVAQATKTGFVFLLDRETGKPLFPVEEKPVPPSDAPGEKAWPTQPFPLKPAPLVPQRLNEADLWDTDQKRLRKCREQLIGRKPVRRPSPISRLCSCRARSIAAARRSTSTAARRNLKSPTISICSSAITDCGPARCSKSRASAAANRTTPTAHSSSPASMLFAPDAQRLSRNVSANRQSNRSERQFVQPLAQHKPELESAMEEQVAGFSRGELHIGETNGRGFRPAESACR